jgi:hypothetical protein
MVKRLLSYGRGEVPVDLKGRPRVVLLTLATERDLLDEDMALKW